MVIASEVRATSLDPSSWSGDVPLAAMVDQETLAKASAFDGDYVFVGGQKERDGIDAAIEASVEALSPMLRNLGRERLRETNPVPKSISIDVEGDTAKIEFAQDGHAARLDGTPVKTKSAQGDRVKVSHRIRGGRLVQFIDGSGGDRRNSFKLSNDGKRLTLNVEITSGHLPVPVEYRLTFKRK